MAATSCQTVKGIDFRSFPFLMNTLSGLVPLAALFLVILNHAVAATGPIRIAKDYPHSFQYQSGERFFPMGDTAYFLIAQPTNVIARLIDSRRAHQFNFIRMMPMARGHWAFGGTPRKPDYTVINETAMRKLDWLFDYAASKGMNIELIIFGYGLEQGEGSGPIRRIRTFGSTGSRSATKTGRNCSCGPWPMSLSAIPMACITPMPENVKWAKQVPVQNSPQGTHAFQSGGILSAGITKENPFCKNGSFCPTPPPRGGGPFGKNPLPGSKI